MPIPPKPRRLIIGPLNRPIVSPAEDVITARRRTWAAWMDECTDIHDQFVEAMLDCLQSAEHG